MMSISFFDLCRWFILGQAVFVAVATALIWVRYIMLALRNPSQPKLWHIITISASYLGAITYIGLSTIERFGQPFSWRLGVAGFVFIAGDAGLCFMLAHLYAQRTYKHELRERLIREEIATTVANTTATEENTAAIEAARNDT